MQAQRHAVDERFAIVIECLLGTAAITADALGRGTGSKHRQPNLMLEMHRRIRMNTLNVFKILSLYVLRLAQSMYCDSPC